MVLTRSLSHLSSKLSNSKRRSGIYSSVSPDITGPYSHESHSRPTSLYTTSPSFDTSIMAASRGTSHNGAATVGLTRSSSLQRTKNRLSNSFSRRNASSGSQRGKGLVSSRKVSISSTGSTSSGEPAEYVTTVRKQRAIGENTSRAGGVQESGWELEEVDDFAERILESSLVDGRVSCNWWSI